MRYLELIDNDKLSVMLNLHVCFLHFIIFVISADKNYAFYNVERRLRIMNSLVRMPYLR